MCNRSPWEGDPSWKIGLGAMCSPCPDITWESLVKGYPCRANSDAQVERVRRVRAGNHSVLAQLRASEHGKFAAHLHRSRRGYRSTCQRAGKSGKQIERCVISTFQVAESMGFNGDFSQWELRIGD